MNLIGRAIDAQTELTPVPFKRGRPMIIDEYSSIPSFNRVESIKSLNKTLLWILEIKKDKNVERAVVGYHPPITESPIEMKVIYAEIERAEKTRVELGTEFIFIEADQTIYTKVLDAMLKMRNDSKDMFKRMTPRMGGFISQFVCCALYTVFIPKLGLFKFLLKLDYKELDH